MVLTSVLFLILASVPTVMVRWPKWASLHAARRIAQQVNLMRRDAIIEESSYRLTLETDIGLKYQVARAGNCDAPAEAWQVTREGRLMTSRLGRLLADRLRVLDPEAGTTLGVPGLKTQVCVHGSGLLESPGSGVVQSGPLAGIAVIHEGDRLTGNIERISVVSLTSPENEVDFE